jgi:hypothetical protein
LAALGYGTQFAPDLEEGDRIADSPVDRSDETFQMSHLLQDEAITDPQRRAIFAIYNSHKSN